MSIIFRSGRAAAVAKFPPDRVSGGIEGGVGEGLGASDESEPIAVCVCVL